MNNFFETDACFACLHGYPSLNVWEKATTFIEAELPGALPDLRFWSRAAINYLKANATDAWKAALHRQERGFGKFVRTLQLPYMVDAVEGRSTLRKRRSS